MTAVLTESHIFGHLKTLYNDATGYALLPQVPNGTGAAQSRTADAIAMQLWPSRGLALTGFEIKVSKGDWRRELKDPSKADAFGRYCHYWYVVAPKGIVQIDELPLNWGLFEVTDTKLKKTKGAPLNEDVLPPNYSFLAGMMRAAQKYVTPDALLKARYEEGLREGRRLAEGRIADVERNWRDLETTIRTFEKASGVKIWAWEAGKIGEAVQQVLNGAPARIESKLERLLYSSQSITKEIETNLNRLKEPT